MDSDTAALVKRMIAAVEAATAAAKAATATAKAATAAAEAATAAANAASAAAPTPRVPPALQAELERERQHLAAISLAREDAKALRAVATAAAGLAVSPSQRATVGRMLSPGAIGVALHDPELDLDCRRALWRWLSIEHVASPASVLARAARIADADDNYALDAFVNGNGWRRADQDTAVRKSEDAVARAARAGLQTPLSADTIAQFILQVALPRKGDMPTEVEAHEMHRMDQVLTFVPPASATQVVRARRDLFFTLLLDRSVTHDQAELLEALLDSGHLVSPELWTRLHAGPIVRRPLTKVRALLQKRGMLAALDAGTAPRTGRTTVGCALAAVGPIGPQSPPPKWAQAPPSAATPPSGGVERPAAANVSVSVSGDGAAPPPGLASGSSTFYYDSLTPEDEGGGAQFGRPDAESLSGLHDFLSGIAASMKEDNADLSKLLHGMLLESKAMSRAMSARVPPQSSPAEKNDHNA